MGSLWGEQMMRKSSRWLGCAAVMCLTVAQLSGCSSRPLVSGFRLPGMKSRSSAAVAEKNKKLSPAEADDLLAQARDYEKQGDFPNAARLYRQYLNGGGAPLRPDAPPSTRDIAKADPPSSKKPQLTDSLDEERDAKTTKSVSRKSAAPPTRSASKANETPPPRVAKKPAPPAEDDPWANSVDKSGDMPIIRPRNSDDKPAAVAKKPTPKADVTKAVPKKPAKADDAGIPDWAKHEDDVAHRDAGRKLTQAEIDDLTDLDGGEIDWGDQPVAKGEEPVDNGATAEESVSPDDLPVVDFDAESSEVPGEDDQMVAPEVEGEVAGSDADAEADPEGTELAKAEDTSWEAHSEDESALEGEAAESDEFAEPVLTDDESKPKESIALLCKDCEPWVYAQAVKLESEDSETRKEALTSLADMGSTARQAGLAVRSMLGDSDPLVQAHAAWALWEIENEPVESVTTLTELLDHPNTEVVQLACYMLGDIGPQADTGRHPLELLRDHAEGSTRIHAAEALIRIAGIDQSSLSVLTQAMRSKDPEERWIAAVALGRCRGDGSRDAVKILVSALKDIDPEVRSAAALSLGGLGPDAVDAKPDLERIARNDDPQVRDAALAALACLKK